MIILSGGKGSRLSSKIGKTPKSLINFKGQPFLIRLLEYYQIKGFQRLVLVLGYYHDQIIKIVKEHNISKICEFIIEDNPNGTGPAMIKGVGTANEEIVMLSNSDTFFAFDPVKLEDTAKEKQKSILLKAPKYVVNKNTSEKKDLSLGVDFQMESTGLLVVFKKHLDKFLDNQNLPKCWKYENTFQPWLIKNNFMEEVISDIPFFDFGISEHYEFLISDTKKIGFHL